SFTVEDKTAPLLSSVSPGNLSVGIAINSLLTIDFSENIAAGSVDKNSVKLFKNGVIANYSLSVSGNRITIDPDDIPEGYMLPDTTYRIEINGGVTDLPGNAFNPSPAPFTSTFTTMGSQTPPTAISTVKLYSDEAFSSQLPADADYPYTGTLYIEFSGTDGQPLTRDSTIASISTGVTATLTETASSTGVYRGSTTFAGLNDRFRLKTQSTINPAASAALLITWPAISPGFPASGAVNVPVNSTITFVADESLNPAKVNNTNLTLSVNGTALSTVVSYDDTLKQISMKPADPLPSEKLCIVSVSNQADIHGNPQIKPIVISFSIEDKTPPTITAVSPADLSTGILINRLLTLDFSENLAGSSVDKNSVKLLKNGNPASYSLSVSGSRITIDPDDLVEGFMHPETVYLIEVSNGVTDLPGNALAAPFASSFTSMASQTTPVSISSVKLFSDNTYSASSRLSANADYAGSGTLYIEFAGVDGQSLTRDATIASISTGQYATLQETASATGIFRGSISFAGLADRFKLNVQSTLTPLASETLLVTWPTLAPIVPASGAVNVPVNSTITISADEPLNAAQATSANVTLALNGSAVEAPVNYSPLLRQITLTPTTLLASEKTYLVTVINQKDLVGNPQTAPLVYKFTIEDKTPPTITGVYPANGAAAVTIDRLPLITFSEAIAPGSISKSSIKLIRNGSAASYSLSLTGNKLSIDPDDGADQGMTASSTYQIEITSAVQDLAGNSLLNLPEPFRLSFSTQPHTTPPTDITSISLYKDPLLITAWGNNEKIPASTTVYLKLVGSDGATQTRDLATVSLLLSWGQNIEFNIQETASNSTGYYIGLFSFATSPLYGVPTPQPPVSAGQLTFAASQKPAMAATLSITFPELQPAQTTVTTLSGSSAAAGANNARIDTSIILSFSDSLLDSGNATAIQISSGSTALPANRVLSADQKRLTIIPTSPLPYNSIISISGSYSDAGLKSLLGNPLYRPFNFNFTTQPGRSPPAAISSLRLFPDAAMSPLNAYVSGQDFKATGILYVEAAGIDGSPNTIDTTMALLSTGQKVELTETSAGSGIYQGSAAYANLSDGFILSAVSEVNPAASLSLTLSIPELLPIAPASAATGVSFATSVSIRADEALNSATVNTSSLKLFSDGIETAGSVSLLSDRMTMVFAPAQNLKFGATCLCQVDGVTDLAGNPPAGPLYFTFSVQSGTVAPVVITSLRAFSDADYSNQLANGSKIAPATTIFVEIAATDLSASTIDTTEAILSTSVSGKTLKTALIETSAASGLFRGSVSIFNDQNALLTVFSAADNAKKTTLRTFKLPEYLILQPASGSTDIYLDTVFEIEAGKALAPASVSTASVLLAGSSGLASYAVTLPAPDRIRIKTALLPSEVYHLKLTAQIYDSEGLACPEVVAKYTTITQEFKEFTLYADAAFFEPIAADGEVEAGTTVYAKLKAVNTRLTDTETATCTYSDGLASTSLPMSEGNAGEFSVAVPIPDS
ncbi:MAG TPA: Ig-like domain-containing protein, partial [Candidatus Rifleibacterium sp.]|nr:Ig-like domain-containing protein [Candidatus Rifleibacterium sp.]